MLYGVASAELRNLLRCPRSHNCKIFIFLIFTRNGCLRKFSNTDHSRIPGTQRRLSTMWCALSRASTIVGAIMSDWVLPDHRAEGVEQYGVQYSSMVTQTVLSPFTKWDAGHYIKLASEGYTSEHQVAFFPLYPLLLKSGSYLLSDLGVANVFGWNEHEGIIIAALAINFAAFIIAHHVLRKLLLLVAPTLSRNTINLATVLFCLNPASIFFSTMYTEALFSALSWSGFYLFTSQYNLLSVILFGLASLLRSNGSFNIIVVLLTWGARSWREHRRSTDSRSTQLWRLIPSAAQVSIVCIAIVLPGFLYNLVHYELLCGIVDASVDPPKVITDLARILWGTLLPTSRTLTGGTGTAQFCAANAQRIWWARSIVYPYIQEKYWNVGLFRYYQWRQIPNFLLAAPIIYIALYCIRHFDAVFGVEKEKAEEEDIDEQERKEKGKRTSTAEQWGRRFLHPAFPLLAHLCVTLAVGVLIANVQITTRLICASCPMIYVGMAHIAEQKEKDGTNRRLLWGYIVLYNVVGVLLHCNYFPWT